MLILGSLPGEASLKAGRYYAHPRNMFWHLAGMVIGHDLLSLDYDKRLEMLLQSGIGLWDTIASATRTGSLDSAIRDARSNELPRLCASLPQLRAVAFNGAKSAATGTRLLQGSGLVQDKGLDLVPLPSSSPAYAAMNLREKQERWLALRAFLS